MKKTSKKLLSLIMCLAMIFTIAPLSGIVPLASAATYSGTCGDNLKWSLDTSTGVLKITGTGNMKIFFEEEVPWSSYRSSIKTVNIGDSVTSISAHSFADCSKLINLTIGNSVKSINDGAFRNCESLASVVIPNSVTTIGFGAFSGCTKLAKITLGSSIASLEADIFGNTGYYNNKNNWENEVLYVGNYLIQAKNSISGDYKIKANTKVIANYAFEYCANLLSIDIPNSVTNIGYCAFEGCEKLSNITIGNGIKNIESGAFYGTGYHNNESNWENNVLYIGNYLIHARGISGEYKIKENTKVIAESAFIGSSNLTSITLPNSVTTIGGWAFEGCINLTNITIPNSVTSIGSCAFLECSNLKSITIPASVTNISESAFSSCDNLSNLKVDTNNKNYSSDSYGVLFNKNKTNLIRYPVGNTRKTYSIPNTVTSVGDDAFSNCKTLTTITIPNSVITIGDFAFSFCSALTSITIPNSVTCISEQSFAYCIKLKDIKLSNKLTTIGDCAFENCTSLGSVTIPEGIKSTGSCMFLYCTALTNVSLPQSLVNIGKGTFDTCSSLKSIIIPNNVKTIGNGAFWNCRSLEKVTIPTSLTTIKNRAFGGDNCLTDIYYADSKSAWNKIKIGEENECLTKATIHYNYGASNTGLASATTKLTSVANTVNGPQLKWSAVSGATGYYVYRKTSGTSWSRIGTTSSTSFIDKTAKAGTTYTYTAKAYKGSTSSKYQSGLTIKYMAAPQIKSVTNSVNGPYMTWNKVAGASGYQVYRKTGANGTWTKIATVTATNYRDTKAKSGTTYYYSVKSYSGKTLSSMRAGTALKFLAAPTLKSLTNSVNGPYMTWNKVAGASGYQVYRKTGSNGTWTKIATVTTLNYRDTTAKSGTTYYYSIKSYSGKTLSSMRSGTALKFLASPTVKTTSATNGVKVTLTAVTGATSYQIYRKTGTNGTWAVIKTVNATSYTDTTAKKGTTYYYSAKAVSGKTTSSMRGGVKGTRK